MLKTFVLSVVILWLAGAAIRSFSKMAANSAKQRREEIDLYEKEAERLDRLRNPSKYRCK
jgi:hypothetical protein